jgi:hypothetical protein
MPTRPSENPERPLPQSLEAERAILGAILLDNAALETVTAKIQTSDFFHTHHRTIFRNIVEMHAKQKPVDLVSLTEMLHNEKTLDSAGGAGYLSQLMDGVPHVANVGHYADIVKEKSRLRSIIRQADATYAAAFESGATADDLESKLRQNVTQHAAPANGNGHVYFQDYSLVDFMAAKFPPKEHLIAAVTPRNGRSMIVALPHRLKSFFTTGLALASTIPCMAFGHLAVEKPVRTYLAQLEDWPGELQYRLATFLQKPQFSGTNTENVRILPRCALDLTEDSHYEFLIGRLKEFKPDHLVLDVLRKFFSGDVNSPKETAAFLKRLDQLQDTIGCALTLVHHENRKKEELMLAAAGSYNWSGWAEVMILFSRKTEAKTENGPITAVEIEVDTKAGPPVDTMRLVLDTSLPHPLRMEALEDGTGFVDAMKQLASEGWTVDNLASVLDVHRKSAWKRIESWMKSGKIEKLKSGKRGRGGGLAIFKSLDPADHL